MIDGGSVLEPDVGESFLIVSVVGDAEWDLDATLISFPHIVTLDKLGVYEGDDEVRLIVVVCREYRYKAYTADSGVGEENGTESRSVGVDIQCASIEKNLPAVQPICTTSWVEVKEGM